MARFGRTGLFALLYAGSFHLSPVWADANADLFRAIENHDTTGMERALEAGANVLAWDGRDDQGRALANGAYFARFVSHGERRNVRVLLLR